MKDDRIHVGIIIGGRSVECEISLISGLQAYYAMDKSKYHPTIFYLDKNNHLFVGETLNDINTYKLENIKKFCNNILFLICFILYKITGFIDKTLKI